MTPLMGLKLLAVGGEFDTCHEVFTPSTSTHTSTHAMAVLLVPTDMNENDEHAATQILLYTRTYQDTFMDAQDKEAL